MHCATDAGHDKWYQLLVCCITAEYTSCVYTADCSRRASAVTAQQICARGFEQVLRKLADQHKTRPFSYLWAEGGSQPALEAAVDVGGCDVVQQLRSPGCPSLCRRTVSAWSVPCDAQAGTVTPAAFQRERCSRHECSVHAAPLVSCGTDRKRSAQSRTRVPTFSMLPVAQVWVPGAGCAEPVEAQVRGTTLSIRV